MKCTNIEWNNHSNNHSKIKIANGAIRTQIRTNYHLSKEYPTAFVSNGSSEKSVFIIFIVCLLVLQLHEGKDRNLSSQMDIMDIYADLFHLNYPNIF